MKAVRFLFLFFSRLSMILPMSEGAEKKEENYFLFIHQHWKVTVIAKCRDFLSHSLHPFSCDAASPLAVIHHHKYKNISLYINFLSLLRLLTYSYIRAMNEANISLKAYVCMLCIKLKLHEVKFFYAIKEMENYFDE